jgi:hypothetical protein
VGEIDVKLTDIVTIEAIVVALGKSWNDVKVTSIGII